MTKYLEINALEADRRLADLLPFDIACRYHALPVAKDGEQITVAMADPYDKNAVDAVLAVMGPSTCIVRADAQFIDSALIELMEKDYRSFGDDFFKYPYDYKSGYKKGYKDKRGYDKRGYVTKPVPYHYSQYVEYYR